MRIPITTLLLLFIFTDLSAQRNAHLTRQQIKENASKPYFDIIASGALLYPQVNYTPKSPYKISAAYMANIGMDLMFNSKHRRLFRSLGPRLGYSNFTATNSYETYYAGAPYLGFAVGINYINNPLSQCNFIISLNLQGGFRYPIIGPDISLYYMPEVKLGVRFNHFIGINFNTFYLPVSTWKGNPLHVMHADGPGFNVFGTAVELRISLGQYK